MLPGRNSRSYGAGCCACRGDRPRARAPGPRTILGMDRLLCALVRLHLRDAFLDAYRYERARDLAWLNRLPVPEPRVQGRTDWLG